MALLAVERSPAVVDAVDMSARQGPPLFGGMTVKEPPLLGAKLSRAVGKQLSSGSIDSDDSTHCASISSDESEENDIGGEVVCLRTYYVYAIVDLSLDDVAELGEADLILTERPMEPPTNTAAVLLCTAKATSSWQRSVEEKIAQWSSRAPAQVRCCSFGRRWSAGTRQLFRPGAAPPVRWRTTFSAGSIWLRCHDALTSKLWEASAALGDAETPAAGRRSLLLGAAAASSAAASSADGAATSSSGAPLDPVRAFHELMIESGFDVPEMPEASDTRSKTRHAKLLHSYDCPEVQQLIDLIRDSENGPAEVRCERKVTLGPVGEECVIS